MADFFVKTFSDNLPLAIFLIALFPMVESRTAIPLGLSKQLWKTATLSPTAVCLISFVGTMLPAIFVILLARKLKQKTSGFVYDRFISKIQNKIRKNTDRFDSREGVIKKCLFLVGFVAVPLPLTGVYTGCLIAGFSDLKIWQAFVSILVGEIVSCVGMTLICVLFENSVLYLLIFSLIVGFVIFVANLLTGAFKRLTSQHKRRQK